MIRKFKNFTPEIHPNAVIIGNAEIIGDCRIAANASIWPFAVLRGDIEHIEIGENSNVQDNATVHTRHGAQTIVGKNVTIGHNAVLHGCTVEDDVLIGMGAIILDNSVIGKGSIIAAGAVVTGKTIPPRSLVMGAPGKVVREVTDAELAGTLENAREYVQVSKEYN